MILSPKPIKLKLYESNIEPLLRYIHHRELKSVGWICIKKYDYFNTTNNPSNNTISIYTDWKNLEYIEDNTIAKFTIASFDIECTSGDGKFPQPTRDEDKVIQIGTTFSEYGSDDCYYRHIITLGSCDKIDGIEVESYDDETNVLLAWTNLIIRTNPDIITGYNIFGFDYKYLEERANKLGCYTSFSKLGRIKNEISPFITKELKSSALGDNKLKYYAMQGRIQIDVMKVIQRDFKLGSYKLDNVASEFIREKIEKVCINNKTNTTKIFTKNIYGLSLGRYIKIYFNDGLSDNSYNNDAKFKVIQLNIKDSNINDIILDCLTIDGILDGEALELEKYQVYWCQAKDDISPNDIFRLQKGTSKDRSIIAFYCIQDCQLVNKLISKLQIITNNISMANVCYVPLSYIFLRGQGVKIYSLVAKKCREESHIIPVIRKNYNNQQSDKKKSENQGYEGATVFEPVLGVHYEPITVLDYNSLYPNSMIYKGISHECIVKNPKYDNLPGYHYENVSYSNKDGTITKCRYAKQINGKIGILCQIIIELLSARSKMRALADNEKDPFTKKILDANQLALKQTANSLYGQLGAQTSPIYMAELAASTTATGRCMLNAARIFAEIIFPKIVKSILNGNYDKYNIKMNLLFDKNIDKLIGNKNIIKLKKIIQGEIQERYDYLEIFKNNIDIIDDNKFIDKFTSNKNEFIKWFFDEIIKILKDKKINPCVIYGDTDSIFIKYNITNLDDNVTLTDKIALDISISLGQLTSKLLYKILPYPQNMIYEKTFHPFIQVSKKRYVGNKYETNPNKFYQVAMGLALKRRDNAPIVKLIVGGIVRSILIDKNPEKAIEFTKKILHDILSCKYPLEKFIITKTLKGNAMTDNEIKIENQKNKEDRVYADRKRIAHVVLADRIANRDPGNKPESNERIPYVYIITKNNTKLQGNRIESPDYIKENNLQLDYLFYITNQIMKPCIQFLELITDNPKKIFDKCIIKEMNRRAGKRPLSFYFNKK